MLEVGRTAGILQKATRLDAEAITAEQIMEMLTINGAKVLGLDNEVGSIEIGKKADVIVVDYNAPHLLPGRGWLPKLIYSARGSDVIHTIIEGQVVMENRTVLTLDEGKVMEKAFANRNDLVQRAGQETRDLLAAPWPKSGPAWRSIVKK